MKHLFTLVLSTIFFSSFTFAQDGKHLVKYNIVPLLTYKDISFEYETAVGFTRTIGTAISYRPSSNVPWIAMIDETNTYNLTQYSHFSIAPEYRRYIIEAHRGFYIGVFIKYTHFMFNTDIPRSDGSHLMTLKVNANAISGGLSLGFEKHLGGNFYLDTRLFGLHYGYVFSDFSKNQTLTLNEQADVENALDGAYTMMIFEHNIDANGVHVYMKQGYGGFRFAISIAYRF